MARAPAAAQEDGAVAGRAEPRDTASAVWMIPVGTSESLQRLRGMMSGEWTGARVCSETAMGDTAVTDIPSVAFGRAVGLIRRAG
ncbi:MAG: hypothetical protein KJO44_07225 [Gemmatimonadetes bacterium]|nr:hypothetical protein [Gemmatimonadota bacterium]